MKNLFIIVVIGAICFVGYKQFFTTSQAYAAYKRFSDAMLHDEWDDAESMASGAQARAEIARARYVPERLGWGTYRTLRGHVHWGPNRELVSETYSDSGERVTIQAVQELRRGPVTMAPVGPPTVRHRQKAVLVQTDHGWAIEEFHDEVENLTRR